MTFIVAGIGGGSLRKVPSTRENRSPLCVVLAEGSDICAVRLRSIMVDGLDATATAIDMLKGCVFDFLITQGVSFAGFNIIDIHALLREFNRPIIVYMNRMPNMTLIRQALVKHFLDWRERWSLFQDLGRVHSMCLGLRKKMIYFEVVGASVEVAEVVLDESTRLSAVPEPVRISRLIAKGVSWKHP